MGRDRVSHTDWCAYPNCLGTCNCGAHQQPQGPHYWTFDDDDGRPPVTDVDICGITSLKGYPCVKPPHPFTENHERWDGRTWPHGQTWGDAVAEYFRREGLDPDGE